MLKSSPKIKDLMIVALMPYMLKGKKTDVDQCGFGLLSITALDKQNIKENLAKFSSNDLSEMKIKLSLMDYIHLLREDFVINESRKIDTKFCHVKLDSISYLKCYPKLENLYYYSFSGYIVLTPKYFYFECERNFMEVSYSHVIFRSSQFDYKKLNLMK